MKAFTDRWLKHNSSVYTDQALSELCWFKGAPGIQLMKLVIDGTIKAGDSVIDLGCGPGVDAVFLALHGMKVTGVDISDAALKRANSWAQLAGVHVNFMQGDVLALELPDHCADVINDSFVFHNMRDEARPTYAHEVHRLLRPGGLFVLNSFSSYMIDGPGPRRVTGREILSTFDVQQFECVELRLYRNLPTAKEQIHWFGQFRSC